MNTLVIFFKNAVCCCNYIFVTLKGQTIENFLHVFFFFIKAFPVLLQLTWPGHGLPLTLEDLSHMIFHTVVRWKLAYVLQLCCVFCYFK